MSNTSKSRHRTPKGSRGSDESLTLPVLSLILETYRRPRAERHCLDSVLYEEVQQGRGILHQGKPRNPDPLSEVTPMEAWEDLCARIQPLVVGWSDEARAAVVLRLRGHTFREIGKLLGRRVAWVHETIETLREFLRGEDD